MEAPTEIYMGTALALGLLGLTLVKWRYKPKQRPEDGRDRAARREEAWYGNSDRNMDVVPIPFENPISDNKSDPEVLSGRIAQP
jgi:hypothetical protein